MDKTKRRVSYVAGRSKLNQQAVWVISQYIILVLQDILPFLINVLLISENHPNSRNVVNIFFDELNSSPNPTEANLLKHTSKYWQMQVIDLLSIASSIYLFMLN